MLLQKTTESLSWMQEIVNFISGNLMLFFFFIGLIAGIGYIAYRMIWKKESLSDVIGVNPQFALEVIVFLTSVLEVVSMSMVTAGAGNNQMLSILRYSPIVVLEVMLSFYAFKTIADVIADGKITRAELWDLLVAIFCMFGSYTCTRLLLWLYTYSIGGVTFEIGNEFIPSFSSEVIQGIKVNPLISLGIMCTPVFNFLAFFFMIKAKVFDPKKAKAKTKKTTSTSGGGGFSRFVGRGTAGTTRLGTGTSSTSGSAFSKFTKKKVTTGTSGTTSAVNNPAKLKVIAAAEKNLTTLEADYKAKEKLAADGKFPMMTLNILKDNIKTKQRDLADLKSGKK